MRIWLNRLQRISVCYGGVETIMFIFTLTSRELYYCNFWGWYLKKKSVWERIKKWLGVAVLRLLICPKAFIWNNTPLAACPKCLVGYHIMLAGRKTFSIGKHGDTQVPQSFSGENFMLKVQLCRLRSCCTGLFVVYVHAPAMFPTPACTLFSMEILTGGGCRQAMHVPLQFCKLQGNKFSNIWYKTVHSKFCCASSSGFVILVM